MYLLLGTCEKKVMQLNQTQTLCAMTLKQGCIHAKPDAAMLPIRSNHIEKDLGLKVLGTLKNYLQIPHEDWFQVLKPYKILVNRLDMGFSALVLHACRYTKQQRLHHVDVRSITSADFMCVRSGEALNPDWNYNWAIMQKQKANHVQA